MDSKNFKTNAMYGVNKFGVELSESEIEQGIHRSYVGGRWKSMGRLQFEFLVAKGLQPDNNLLDIGCGPLRGGVHFIAYLDKGNYTGIDTNSSLITAAGLELKLAGLTEKEPQLFVNGSFDYPAFERSFDFGLAVSLFTHLPANLILDCLTKTKVALSDNGKFFASIFLADGMRDSIVQSPTGVVTFPNTDPYHYTVDQLARIANHAGLRVSDIREWAHPHGQKMIELNHL